MERGETRGTLDAVDDIGQLLAAERHGREVRRRGAQRSDRLRRGRGVVRGDDHVVQFQERAVRGGSGSVTSSAAAES